jgi:hypothetical protein
MENTMTTYLVVAWDGRTTHISAYTESEAREVACDFCGDSGIKEMRAV